MQATEETGNITGPPRYSSMMLKVSGISALQNEKGVRIPNPFFNWASAPPPQAARRRLRFRLLLLLLRSLLGGFLHTDASSFAYFLPISAIGLSTRRRETPSMLDLPRELTTGIDRGATDVKNKMMKRCFSSPTGESGETGECRIACRLAASTALPRRRESCKQISR